LRSEGAFLRLETKGRKTSLPHIVELRFAKLGESFYLFAGGAKSDWVLNALNAGKARVLFSSVSIEVSARAATEEERLVAEKEFVRRYGKGLFERWYRAPRTCLCLTVAGQPQARRGSGGELDAKTTYAQWEASRRDFYADVGGAFDLASEEYDFTIRRNFINTWIRERSIDILRGYTRPEDVLLEVGCGTGAETVEVAKNVSAIIAIDISQKMVDLLSAKATAKGLSKKIQAHRLSAADVSRVVAYLGDRRIRLAYSFNGALNCEPHLERFVTDLHALLEPGGYFICSIRNTICLSEMLSHALVMQFDKATPRKRQPSMVSVGGTDIPSTYYSPRRFKKFFEPKFRLREMIALPALLPPAYLSNYYLKARRGFPLLEKLDLLVSDRFPFRLLGDQTMFVFQKA
jgi:SAM-dependent methyltransferase